MLKPCIASSGQVTTISASKCWAMAKKPFQEEEIERNEKYLQIF